MNFEEWVISEAERGKFERCVEACKRAEQTLLNLAYGELSGDAKQIALNEATNIRKLLDELG